MLCVAATHRNRSFLKQAKVTPSKNALLSDVCIGTSAAPTYLPAHYFCTKDANREQREYNLIDGGVAANNPVCNRQHFTIVFLNITVM